MSKIQDVRQKAAQLASMVESAPAKAAELHDVVLATAGQLHQMRRTLQSAATGLVAHSEESLIAALHDIDQSADSFRTAGYVLEDVEMELASVERLIVHLEKIEEVPTSTLRSLAEANEGRPAVHAIFTALLKAEDMADKVSLRNLRYHQLMVYVGPVPSVRLCWRAPEIATPLPVAAVPVQEPVSTGTAFNSMLGHGSFFEPRSPIAPRSTPASQGHEVSAEPALHKAVVEPLPVATAAPVVPVREDPLARFKKMPDLSRLR